MGVAAVFVVLVLGVVASTWEAVQAWQAEAKARQQSAIAQAVNDFLQNDLLAQASASNQSGPSTKPDPDLTVRTALDRAAQRIEGKFDKQPEVEAAIRNTMGKTYAELAQYAESQKQLERALGLERRVWGLENPKTLDTLNHLGRTAWLQGKYPDAETLLLQTLEIQRRVLGPEHPDTLYSMNTLANVYRVQGKDAQAEALYSLTLEIRRRVLGPEHPDTLVPWAIWPAPTPNRPSTRRPRRSSAKPGRSAAACWVRNIPGLLSFFLILQTCTNDRANMPWRRLLPRRSWRDAGVSWDQHTRTQCRRQRPLWR